MIFIWKRNFISTVLKQEYNLANQEKMRGGGGGGGGGRKGKKKEREKKTE